MKRAAMFSLLVSVGLSACSWFGGGSDNTEPPAELVELEPSLNVELLWEVDTGAGAGEHSLRLQPAVADDRVFVAGRKGALRSIKLADGATEWEVETESIISAGPGVGDGLVVLGTRDGTVLAYRLADGSAVWRAVVSSEVLAIPQISQGIVVVRTIDGRVRALNAETGRRAWIYELREPALTLRGTSSPVIVGRTVLVGFDNGKLSALALDTGELRWEQAIAVPRGRSELERIVDIDADPIVVGDTVYVATYQGRIAALNVDTGRPLWDRDMSAYSGLTIVDRQLFISDQNSFIWAMDNSNGAAIWKQDKLRARAVTAPVVVGEYVVVGDFEGYLHWLSRSEGRFVARVRGDSDGLAVGPVVHGGTLLALGRSGELSAFRVRQP